MTMKLKAEIRTTSTRSANRELRLAKKVPAVVYGKKNEPLMITLDQKDVLKAMQHPSALLELELAGQASRRVVLQSVQRDPIVLSIQSVDFHEVSLSEPVKTNVHIVPLPDPDGKSIPYQMFIHEIQVQCLPDQIPAAIELDLSPIRQGHTILVKDLPVPDDVRLLTRLEEVVAAPFHPVSVSVEGEEAVV